MVNRENENKLFEDYISKLPQVPLDAPLERGRLYHTVVQHDDWCGIYNDAACNCSPIVSRYIEPLS